MVLMSGVTAALAVKDDLHIQDDALDPTEMLMGAGA